MEDPAYNKPHVVIGFIALKVTDISPKADEPGQVLRVRGILTKSTGLGDDVPSEPDPAPGPEDYTLGPVKLID